MSFSPASRFTPHGLDEQAITNLQAQLKRVHGLSEAYLVRKVVESSEAYVYVLAAVAGYTWKNGQNAKHVNALIHELIQMKNLPEPIVFLSLDGQHSYLLPTMRVIPGARLFAAEP
jgi:hypothetical protein